MKKLLLISTLVGLVLAGCGSGDSDVKVSGQGVAPEKAGKAKVDTMKGKSGSDLYPD